MTQHQQNGHANLCGAVVPPVKMLRLDKIQKLLPFQVATGERSPDWVGRASPPLDCLGHVVPVVDERNPTRPIGAETAGSSFGCGQDLEFTSRWRSLSHEGQAMVSKGTTLSLTPWRPIDLSILCNYVLCNEILIFTYNFK